MNDTTKTAKVNIRSNINDEKVYYENGLPRLLYPFMGNYYFQNITDGKLYSYSRSTGVTAMKGRGQAELSRSVKVSLEDFSQYIHDEGFYPGLPFLYENNNRWYLNRYFTPHIPVEVNEHRYGLLFNVFKNLLKHLCNNNLKILEYVMDWIASLIQYPEVVMPVVPIFISRKQGVGKTLLAQHVKAMMGRRNCATINAPQFHKDLNEFNSILFQRALIFIDEFSMNDEQESNFKQAINGDEGLMNDKGVKKVQAKVTSNFMCATNSYDKIRLTKNDRRYLVIETSDQLLSSEEYANIANLLKIGEVLKTTATTQKDKKSRLKELKKLNNLNDDENEYILAVRYAFYQREITHDLSRIPEELMEGRDMLAESRSMSSDQMELRDYIETINRSVITEQEIRSWLRNNRIKLGNKSIGLILGLSYTPCRLPRNLGQQTIWVHNSLYPLKDYDLFVYKLKFKSKI